MKKNKDPKNDKPKIGSAPPTEPTKPKPVNDEKPSFRYNALSFDDYFISEGRRFVRFFVENGDNPYYITTTYGEYIEYQLAVWEAKNKIAESVKDENEEVCVCDICNPSNFEKLDDMELQFNLVDEKGEETVITETLPVYFVNFLAEAITVGGCPIKHKEK